MVKQLLLEIEIKRQQQQQVGVIFSTKKTIKGGKNDIRLKSELKMMMMRMTRVMMSVAVMSSRTCWICLF